MEVTVLVAFPSVQVTVSVVVAGLTTGDFVTTTLLTTFFTTGFETLIVITFLIFPNVTVTT